MALPIATGVIDDLAREGTEFSELQDVSRRWLYCAEQNVGHECLSFLVETHPHRYHLAPSTQHTDGIVAYK